MHLVHPVAVIATLNCENATNLHGQLVHHNLVRTVWSRHLVPMAVDPGEMQRPPAMGTCEITDDDVTYFDRKSLVDN